MRNSKIASLAGVAAGLLLAAAPVLAQSAATPRSATVLPAAVGTVPLSKLRAGSRRTLQESGIVGAPLLLLALGAVAVTAVTVAVVDDGGNDSPG